MTSPATVRYAVSYTSTVLTSGSVEVPAEILEGLTPDEAQWAAYDYAMEHRLQLNDVSEEELGIDDDSVDVELA